MTRAHSKFIPGEQINDAVDWTFAAVDQSSSKFAAKLRAQAEAEEQERIADVRNNGFAEGHEKGFSEGFAQGHAKATLEGQRQLTEYIDTKGQEIAASMANLFASASAQLAASEQVIAQGVLELACGLARQVLRNELSINPNALLPVIREALDGLLIDGEAVKVRMNPIDHDMLAEALQQEFAGMKLTATVDATISRGGCIVESAGTVVDGTIEKRWHRVVASLGVESAWEVSDAAS
jgi:flagellar assembly protein FliH